MSDGPWLGLRRTGLELLLLLAAACGTPEPGTLEAAARQMTAAAFAQPYDMPAASLVDHHGDTVALRTATNGKITFLYFGYTSCPDVCPITMATLARGLALLDPVERDRVAVVFVTLDPTRDDPDQIRRWLGAMDTTFIGLTGTQQQVDSVLASFGYVMPPAQTPPEGTYEVAHPSTLFLFTPELLGRFGYPFDTVTPEALAEDVRQLLTVAW